MTDTLDQLRRQFATPCPTLEAVREAYFPHIRTDKHLIDQIRKGRIKLTVKRVHQSVRAPRVVYLYDLATYLDAQAKAA
ncbi:pyocin activator PrtN family protein [Pseudomonas chlororaphis subsp. aurantiaca]|uniref:pyocin activator PrtN family protein n=1 Tax=Pseudomonas chlororaphis TaxID=587753 RepID=UPI0027DBD396|nr:pyocin activator PrtN family protein [Pseudomonas chlororaphis]WMJ01369.1 pyocin activator PrtN family protein [Pseudomonas chlororaphis subsp. aurantiaca]